jgi:hypothetical protein
MSDSDVRKYYCNICFQEFTRRWNMTRHRQMMHGNLPGLTQPFWYGNQNFTTPYQLKHFNKTPVSSVSEMNSDMDKFYKINILGQLQEIKTLLRAILYQGSQRG